MCNEDLCEEGCDSDGDIGSSFDTVLDEEDVEYFTENVINNKIGIDDVTISSVVSSVGTRGSKKSKDEKNPTRLNEKNLGFCGCCVTVSA